MTPPLPNRQSGRLRGYDYAQSGIYFVTICAYRHAPLFGQISDGVMHLNDLGRLVDVEWRKTARVRPSVDLDLHVVMPNHFHGLLILRDGAAPAAGDGRPGVRANSLGAIMAQFKSMVTKKSRQLARPPGMPIWKRSYHDHIVRNKGALERIRQYIMENPGRWHEDRFWTG